MADATMADMQQQPMPEQAPEQGSSPDGGDPTAMVGYIPEEYPAKIKTYLAAARKVYLRDETAAMIRKMLGAANDPAHALALFVGKIIDSLETKLGPLTDDEHDKVALIICGWLASTMQAMGMPGMDSPEGRQDFMGRILNQLDSMQQEQPQEGAEDAQQPPMGQFQPQQAPPGGVP